MLKKLAAVFLSASLLIGLTPAAAMADGEEFVIKDGILTAYNGAGGDVVIPNGVTVIGPSAFYNKDAITSVTFPEGLRVIGIDAFRSCDNLTSLVVPDGTEYIGQGAFATCGKLSDVSLGEGVTVIGESAFEQCGVVAGHISVTLPDSLKFIGEEAFYHCESLTDITLPGNLERIGNGAFRETGLTSIEIPASVTHIGDNAFQQSDLTEVTIPANVGEIGYWTFQDCDQLTSVVIEDGVTAIGGGAFAGCTALTDIVVPDSVEEIGPQAFRNCQGLVEDDMIIIGTTLMEYTGKNGEVIVPEGVTTINSSAFIDKKDILTSLTLPESLEIIEPQAFRYCHKLTSLTMPSHPVQIGAQAFDMCDGLARDSFIIVQDILFGYKSDSSTTTLSIPTGIKEISDEAFYYQSALTSVTIPEGVISIGRAAFNSCSNLESVSLPSTLTYIGPNAFANCNKLLSPEVVSVGGAYVMYRGKASSVSVPEGITVLSNRALYDNKTLSSVTLPSTLRTIGKEAFSSCSALTTITIPNGVTDIGENAFTRSGLTSVTIPGSVILAPNAFYDTTNLKKVTLSSGITAVPDYCFRYCSALTEIILPDTLEYIGKEAFIASPSLNTITIPESVTYIYDGSIGYHKVTSGNEKNENLTIYGTPNSAAELYALANGFTFIDVNEKPFENPFVDVADGAYFYEPVMWALREDITAGTDDTHFSPKSDCSRGQVVTFLWRAAGSPEPKSSTNPFTDVKTGKYYTKAVLWAVENNITAGLTKTTFGPNAPCTRGQVVTFLHRAKGLPADYADISAFKDVTGDKFYYNAVRWAVKNNVTVGTSPSAFSPNATCQRGQIVTFLYRAYQ